MSRLAPLLVLVAALGLGSARASPALELQPGSAKPGDAILITLRDAGMPLRGGLGTTHLRFYRWQDGARALTALPVSQPLGTLDVWIELKPGPDGGAAGTFDAGLDAGDESAEAPETPEDEEPDAGPLDAGKADAGKSDAGTLKADAGVHGPGPGGVVEVVEPNFPARELSIANKFIHPPKSVRQQIADDNKAIREAYHQGFRAPLFTRNFVWPRASEITSHFGDRRLFNGQQQSQHFGTDLEGRVGDPIVASNTGTVVLARECYASGNTVLIYHGLGLYSAYFHMTRMDVKAGDHVKRAQRIGVVGKTGRVTGPHLHFGIKLLGNYVNPESVLRLDFED